MRAAQLAKVELHVHARTKPTTCVCWTARTHTQMHACQSAADTAWCSSPPQRRGTTIMQKKDRHKLITYTHFAPFQYTSLYFRSCKVECFILCFINIIQHQHPGRIGPRGSFWLTKLSRVLKTAKGEGQKQQERQHPFPPPLPHTQTHIYTLGKLLGVLDCNSQNPEQPWPKEFWELFSSTKHGSPVFHSTL